MGTGYFAVEHAMSLVSVELRGFIFLMPPCHATPLMRQGTLIDPNSPTLQHVSAVAESCDYCGSSGLEWRKCKLICADCKQINKSCADL